MGKIIIPPLLPPEVVARRNAEQAALRQMLVKSPALRKTLRKAVRAATAPAPQRTGKGEMKRQLLAEARRVSGNPAMTWGQARKWLKKRFAREVTA